MRILIKSGVYMQEGGLKRAVGGCSMHEFSVNFNLMLFDYFLSSSLDVG